MPDHSSAYSPARSCHLRALQGSLEAPLHIHPKRGVLLSDAPRFALASGRSELRFDLVGVKVLTSSCGGGKQCKVMALLLCAARFRKGGLCVCSVVPVAQHPLLPWLPSSETKHLKRQPDFRQRISFLHMHKIPFCTCFHARDQNCVPAKGFCEHISKPAGVLRVCCVFLCFHWKKCVEVSRASVSMENPTLRYSWVHEESNCS